MKGAMLSAVTGGVFVITVTPFDERGEVDLDGARQMVDYFVGLGVQGLTILGVAGEASKMTQEECESLAACVIDHMAGRLPVVAGISNSSFANVVALGRRVMELGAAGVMLQPIGSMRGDDDVYRYMEAVLKALGSDVPVVYQDYPQVSGVNMVLPVWTRLVRDFPQITMLKHEQLPGLGKLSSIGALERDEGLRHVTTMVGNNAIYFPHELRRGADGAMTGFAYPDMLLNVLKYWRAGEEDRAEDLFDAYLPLLRYELQPGLGLSVRKEILVRRGAIRHPKVRYPGTQLTPEDYADIENLTRRLKRRLAAMDPPESLK